MSALCMVLLLVTVASPALAKTLACKATHTLKVYAKATEKSKVVHTLKKGDAIKVTQVKGKWARVKSGSKVGYVLKSGLQKVEKGSKVVETGKNNKGKRRSPMQRVQAKLVSKGYLAKSAATGKANLATEKALKSFQTFNNLKITGKANSATVHKLFSGKAKASHKVNNATWAKSGINTKFRKRGLATVIDLDTGTRLKIRRVGGHNHLDVEPKTRADTAKLKKIYGGAWSWDSRPILLIAGGRSYAAAMNGMPHGAQISKDNGFEGQFCIHLEGSLTHGSEKVNPLHQANIAKVARIFN
ncbi:MAG: peptidoglycan-binding protein [Clostridia bacterium]